MYRFHRRRGAAATIASYPREVKIDFGVLMFGDDPHVLTGYHEKPEYSFQVSMGVYILDPVAWDYLDAGPAACRCPTCSRRCAGTGTTSTASARSATGSTSAGTTTTRLANEIFESRRSQFLGDRQAETLKIGRDQ